METEEEYYQVKIIRSKETGRELSEEWYHDPKPKDDLKLHGKFFHPARTVFDPETGFVLYTQDYRKGELFVTVTHSHKPPFPEPNS